MARKVFPSAEKGSQKWIQLLVNSFPQIIDDKLKKAFKFDNGENIRWLSPLSTDEFAEYSDWDFLNVLNLKLGKRSLETFWPTRGGPQWDALAKTSRDRVILVEAKSHINEVDSPRTAASDSSLKLIHASLNETKQALNIESKTDWSTCFYQYTNRLAFLYFLRKNDILAYLINIYFINDVIQDGPKSEEEWLGAIKLLKKHLGVKRHKLSPYMADIFINVKELT